MQFGIKIFAILNNDLKPVLGFCNAAGSGPVFNQLVPVTIIVNSSS